jgi:hypothetical protein
MGSPGRPLSPSIERTYSGPRPPPLLMSNVGRLLSEDRYDWLGSF